MTLTTISIQKQTKEKLDSLKVIPRESYDYLLNRILSEQKDD